MCVLLSAKQQQHGLIESTFSKAAVELVMKFLLVSGHADRVLPLVMVLVGTPIPT